MSDEPNRVPARVVEALGAQGLLSALTDTLKRLNIGDGGIPTRPEMSPPGAPEVIKAIVEMMKQIGDIPKLGHNKVDNYDYVRWADLSGRIHDVGAKIGLVIAPRTVGKNIKGKVLFLDFQFDVYHVSGQYIINMCSGPGACRFEFKSGTTDDKAANKAFTAGQKSLLTALFKVPSDVDQDIEREVFTDPDGQLTGEDARRNQPPNRDDRPRDDRPPSTRAYDPETGEIQDTPSRRDERPPDRPAPPHFSGPPSDDYGGRPPPGFDDAPPFDGEPVLPPPVNPPSPSPAAVARDPDDFRRNVQSLDLSLKDARSLDDADRIWKENSDLLRGMSVATFEYFRENFKTRHSENPPNI